MNALQRIGTLDNTPVIPPVCSPGTLVPVWWAIRLGRGHKLFSNPITAQVAALCVSGEDSDETLGWSEGPVNSKLRKMWVLELTSCLFKFIHRPLARYGGPGDGPPNSKLQARASDPH